MPGKLSSFFDAKDMTTGSPTSNLVQFSVPLLIGNFAQQMYNTVDSIIVGKYVGDHALAAVGASVPILNLLLVLFIGISTGAGIMVSQYFGARQRDLLSKTVGNTVVLTFLSSLFIMLVGSLITAPLMSLLNTPPEIYDMACSYLIIIFLGIAGMAFYNIISGILRGLGDSFMPLVFLLVACGLNIVLDLYFVAELGWGVAGVAWATVIAQVISSVLCVFRMLRMKNIMTVDKQALKLNKELVWRLTKLGLPSGLTQAVFSMAGIVVQSLTNSFGTNVIACSTVVMRVDGFAMMPNFTFGTAMTTYAGQNVGANRIDRVNQGTKDGMRLGIITSIILVAAILLFGRGLMGMFTNTQEVVDLGMHMMSILALGYVAMAVTQILSGVMRGAGDTMTPMWISLLTTVVIRVPIAYGIAFFTRSAAQPNGTPDSLFISLLISWILGATLTVICYRRGKWRSKAIIHQTATEVEATSESPCPEEKETIEA